MNLEKRITKYLDQNPEIDPTAYVADSATVIGAVTLAKHSSVWHGAVLRADINSIEVGVASNIQDGTVVHLADDYGVIIGKYVTIGHTAVIHACTIGDECLIGMQATILDGAIIGKHCIIGAHTLVTQGARIPEGSLVTGIPGKVIRSLSNEEIKSIKALAEKYIRVASEHKKRAEYDSKC